MLCDDIKWPPPAPSTVGKPRRLIQKVPVREALESLRIAVVALPCSPELTVGGVVTELGSLIKTRMMVPWSNRGQVEVVNQESRRGQSGSQVGLVCWALWRWLMTYGILRNKIEAKQTGRQWGYCLLYILIIFFKEQNSKRTKEVTLIKSKDQLPKPQTWKHTNRESTNSKFVHWKI